MLIKILKETHGVSQAPALVHVGQYKGGAEDTYRTIQRTTLLTPPPNKKEKNRSKSHFSSKIFPNLSPKWVQSKP